MRVSPALPALTAAALAMLATACGHSSSPASASAPSASSAATAAASSGGNNPASVDVACKLLTMTEVNTFAPPDGNLHAVVTGSGPLKSGGTTDHVCGYAFWTGGAVNQGTEDGDILVDLACGPDAANSMLSDEVSSPLFTIGSTTAAIGLTRGLGSSGTGDPQAVLNNAVSVAKAINACG